MVLSSKKPFHFSLSIERVLHFLVLMTNFFVPSGAIHYRPHIPNWDQDYCTEVIVCIIVWLSKNNLQDIDTSSEQKVYVFKCMFLLQGLEDLATSVRIHVHVNIFTLYFKCKLHPSASLPPITHCLKTNSALEYHAMLLSARDICGIRGMCLLYLQICGRDDHLLLCLLRLPTHYYECLTSTE